MIKHSKTLTNIAFDWLQVCCKYTTLVTASNYSFFQVKKMPYQTRHFKDVFIGFVGDKEIFSLVCNPHSPKLDKQIAILKLNNSVLYTDNFKILLLDVLKELGLIFQSITRLDLAYDFNKFSNGTDPQIFIQRFMSNEYIKRNKSNFKVQGFHDKKHTFDYLRFGSPTSIVSYYLYNKSKEMRDVKHKPHIFDTWIKNNLDIDSDIWRLEFSITSNRNTLINTDSGECINFNSLDILEAKYIVPLYHTLVNNYFVFYKNQGQKIKSRNRRLNILPSAYTNIMFKDVSQKEESNRMTKIVLKKLDKLNHEMRGTDFDFSIFSNNLVSAMVQQYDLNKWANEKLQYTTLSINNETERLKTALSHTNLFKTKSK